MRLLLYVFLLGVLWVVLTGRATGQRVLRRRPAGAVTRMVRCARCGVHLPEGEAIREGEKYFCCLEHRQTALPPRR